MSKFKKSLDAKRSERLRNDNDTLKNRIYFLESENKKLNAEIEMLYEYYAKVGELESTYIKELEKIKQVKKELKKEKEEYISLKKDYRKTMEKFFETLR